MIKNRVDVIEVSKIETYCEIMITSGWRIHSITPILLSGSQASYTSSFVVVFEREM